MRTKTLLAAAAMLAAGLASSMAQSNVYSLNVVGYVNKTFLGGNRYTSIANALNTSSNTLGSLLTVPTGTQVLKYSTADADYRIFNKSPSGWTGGGSTVSLDPGEGILVLIAGADLTNTFVGEVLQGNLTNSFLAGYNQKGNKVPDSGSVTNLGLAPATGSQLLKWNTALQDWGIFNKSPSSWSPSVPSLDVGEGFIMFVAAPYNWVRNFTVQ